MFSLNVPLSPRLAFGLRLAVGAIFGFIIAVLIGDNGIGSRDHDPFIWKETLAMALALVATVIWAGAGAMRRLSLAIWALVAFGVLYGLCWFAFDGAGNGGGSNWLGSTFLIFPLLFIAHELVSSGDQAGKLIAPFETYFDEAWKRGVQLALAIAFTILFWGILWLGAALLGFIGFDWLKTLLQNDKFATPITGMAFGTAVHLGDVQTKLLANVRSLILGVLSWLLPVITLIGFIFAASLLVSGLAPLWATKAATATLLGACVGFVLLINATYQQGDVERSVPVVLKWCVRGAALLLLVFSVLAAWSLSLRIGQYGLTPERVFAGLGVLIALSYGVGYGVAAFVPGRWMAAIEPLNIGLAMFKCALFLAILTPLATPDRLSVHDQAARLNSGKVSVDKFDWWLLKDDTGRYGKKALEKLAQSSNPSISAKAKEALGDKIGNRPSRDTRNNDQPIAIATSANIAAIPVISPADGKLPDSFTKTDFSASETIGGTPSCLRTAPENGGLPTCKAAFLDLNNDGNTEILVREGPSLYVFTWVNQMWVGNTGYIDIGSHEADFDAGKLSVTKPIWADVMIGGKRIEGIEFLSSRIDPKDPVAPVTQKAAPSSK